MQTPMAKLVQSHYCIYPDHQIVAFPSGDPKTQLKIMIATLKSHPVFTTHYTLRHLVANRYIRSSIGYTMYFDKADLLKAFFGGSTNKEVFLQNVREEVWNNILFPKPQGFDRDALRDLIKGIAEVMKKCIRDNSQSFAISVEHPYFLEHIAPVIRSRKILAVALSVFPGNLKENFVNPIFWDFMLEAIGDDEVPPCIFAWLKMCLILFAVSQVLPIGYPLFFQSEILQKKMRDKSSLQKLRALLSFFNPPPLPSYDQLVNSRFCRSSQPNPSVGAASSRIQRDVEENGILGGPRALSDTPGVDLGASVSSAMPGPCPKSDRDKHELALTSGTRAACLT